MHRAKYIARVRHVLRPGIHKLADIHDGELQVASVLPPASTVEITFDGQSRQGSCMLFRYTDAGDVCGDTWHETIDDAFAQAEFEYGLTRRDFVLAEGWA